MKIIRVSTLTASVLALTACGNGGGIGASELESRIAPLIKNTSQNTNVNTNATANTITTPNTDISTVSMGDIYTLTG